MFTSRRLKTRRRFSIAQFRSNRRRQIIILFSGGEPTLSPYYLEAVAYAKKIGFYRILAATNGIRFAEDIEFCKAAKAAGQHGVYLQFDGVSEEKNKHRGVGNLFDVKLRRLRISQRRHQSHAGRNDRQHHQQRRHRSDRRVCREEYRQGSDDRVPTGFVHRPRRRYFRRVAHEAALHARRHDSRSEEISSVDSFNRCATGSRSRLTQHSPA